MTRTEDIIATAGELHVLLQGATEDTKAYVRYALTPKAPYDRRVLGMLYQLFCDGKLTGDHVAHAVGRLRDADFGKGTNSARSQIEIAAQRHCSVDTIQRADAALIKVGLATKRRARRSAGILTMIMPDKLDQLFVQAGGEMPKSDQGHADVQPKGDQEAASALRLQDDLRDRTSFAASKIKKPQNEGLRSRTSSAALPYKDLKNKGARASRAADPNLTVTSAIRRWVVSGDADWRKHCAVAWGDLPPDSYDCAVYFEPTAKLRGALVSITDYLTRIGRQADDAMRTRLKIVSDRIADTSERRVE